MARTTRQRVALIGLAVGVLITGALAAGDALARRGVSVREAIERLQEAVAVLLGRVDAIEEADCGCPARFEPVCISGTSTYLNFCEAACVLARQGVGDFEDLIQHGLPREVDLHTGPCPSRLCDPNVCIDGACPRGFHCADARESGVCVPRCYCGPEPDSPRQCTRSRGCLPVCVPDEADGPHPAPPPPVLLP